MLKVDDVGEAFARKSKQRKSKNLPKIRRLHKKQVRSNKDASKGRDKDFQNCFFLKTFKIKKKI